MRNISADYYLRDDEIFDTTLRTQSARNYYARLYI